MAAKVRIANGEEIRHPSGEEIQVVDEHLHVRGQGGGGFSGDVIAIYAPKAWTRAYIEVPAGP